jgi:ferrous iron transport protein B
MNPFRHRHGDADGVAHGATDLPVVALVGRPNVGKSTVLGRASGRFVESMNAPGSTVIAERRRVRAGGREAWLVDLPGTSSLHAAPVGDPFWRMLLALRPDAILVVADAGDLPRHLPLVLAVRDLGLPMVVMANLDDEARRRGVELDTGRLSQLLVAPVAATVARNPGDPGLARALEQVVELAHRRVAVRTGRATPSATTPAPAYGAVEHAISTAAGGLRMQRSLGAASLDAEFAALATSGTISTRGAATLALGAAADAGARLEDARAALAERWARVVAPPRAAAGANRPPLADRLGRLATAPFPGLPAFVLVTVASLLAMILVGGLLSALLTDAWMAAASPLIAWAIHAVVPDPGVAEGLLWGLDGGLLAILAVGIPYVLTFYIVLAALEDSGYLSTAAVLTDRLFNAVGLPGRAAVPLLAATGCNVPAIYGTRILGTRRERVLASFLIALTPCSATSAVVIAAIAPAAGPVAALGAFGLVAAVAIVAGVGANRMVPGRQPPLVTELAPLRLPVPRAVAAKAWARFRAFVVMAAPLMVGGSILLGWLWHLGLVAPVGALLEPVAGMLGLPSLAVVALGFGFLRKELALQLLVALAIAELGPRAVDLGTFLSPGQLAVFAVVTAFSIPCVATVAAMAGELGSRLTAIIGAATVGIALVVGAILARVVGIA